MKKRCLSLLLALAMVLSLAPAVSTPASAETVTASTAWYTANPNATSFTISTAADLLGLSQLMPSVSFSGDTITLANDINLNNVPFTPIGTSTSAYFDGTFDGNGHTISGLNVSTTADYAGLFGVAYKATIRNVTVSGTVTGGNYVAGIVGFPTTSCIINNCTNTCSVTGTEYVGGIAGFSNSCTIKNCTNTGAIRSTSLYIGGIVGTQNSTTTINCTNNGSVSSTYYNVDGNGNTSDVCAGGISGSQIGGSIINCINNAKVRSYKLTAGIVAYEQNGGKIINCTNNGLVISNQNDESSIEGYNQFAGGIVGYLTSGTVVNCLNTGECKGSLYVGGIAAWVLGGTVTDCANVGVLYARYAQDSSGKTSIGGITTDNRGTITSCYYRSDYSNYANGTSKALADMKTSSFVNTMNGLVNTYNNNSPAVKACQWKLEGGALMLNPVHEHSWSYSASGAVLYATCNELGCILDEALPLTISAQGGTYSGASYAATVNTAQSGVWTQYGLTVPTVNYSGRDGTTYSSTTAPSGGGKYTASITVGSTTASVNFEIAQRTWTEAPTVTMESYDYGTTPSTPANSAGITEGVTYYYSKTNSTEGGTAWDASATLLSGTYYMYAVFAENANMKGVTTAAVEFQVYHQHSYTLEVQGTDSIVATCVSGEGCGGDSQCITMKIADAEYTGEAYAPEGVAAYENVSKNTVEVKYFNLGSEVQLNAAPVNAGSYSATMTVGGKSVTAEFEITKKAINKPTVDSDWVYTYTGSEQTFKFETFDDTLYSVVSGTNKRTDTGTQTVSVALSNSNYKWADDTTGNAGFTFTISPKRIPVPTADPRVFTFTGEEQEYLVCYVVNNQYCNYNGILYNVSNNKQTAAGTYTVSVTPVANYAWEDGTTTAKTFDFTIATKTMTAGIFFFKDKDGNVVHEYDYGSYLYDDENPENTKVSTHYTPNFYNLPEGATYTVKVAKKYYYDHTPYFGYGKDWDTLTFTDLDPGVYYIYAEVSAPGYEDYTTPYTWFRINKAPILITSFKRFKVTGCIQHSCGFLDFSVGIKWTKNEDRDVKSRYFSNSEDVKKSILDDLNNGCVFTLIEILGIEDKSWVCSEENKDKLALLVQNSIDESLELGTQSINDGKDTVLELTTEGLGELGINASSVSAVAGKEFETSPEAAVEQGTVDTSALEEFCKANFIEEEVTVSFDVGYTEKEQDEATAEDFIGATQTVNIGSKITDPGLTRKGYSLKGWYYLATTDDPDEELTLEANGVKWDFENDVVGDNITLYAVWEKQVAHDVTLTVGTGEGEYATIEAALDAGEEKVTNGENIDNLIIKLGSDITEYTEVTIGYNTYRNMFARGQKITLDLNDHLFTGTLEVYDSTDGCFNITVTDSTPVENRTTRYYTADKNGAWTLAEDQTTPTDYSTVGGAICVSYDESGESVYCAISIQSNNQDNQDGSFTMKDCTLAGCHVKSCGVVIKNLATVTIENCTFTNNSAATGDGGAVYVDVGKTGTCSFTECTFTNNSAATGDGGAVYAKVGGTGTCSFDECTFTNNSAVTGDGGAVYAAIGNSGVCNFTGCTFTNNSTAKYSGGAVYVYVAEEETGTSGKCNFADCTFTKNSAAKNGGAVYVTAEETDACSFTCSFAGCTFTENSAALEGGAVYFMGSYETSTAKLSFTGVCNFTGNRCNTSEVINHYLGGAIFAQYSTVSLINSENTPAVFKGNISTPIYNAKRDYYTSTGGDAIYAQSSNLTVSGYNFTENGHAKTAGTVVYVSSLYSDSESKITVTGNGSTTGIFSGNNGICFCARGTNNNTDCVLEGLQFKNNNAYSEGNSLVSIETCSLTMQNTVISENKDEYAGFGNLYIYQGTAELKNVTVTGNESCYSGGIVSRSANTTMENCTVTDNTGAWAGGIFAYGGSLTLKNTKVQKNKCDITTVVRSIYEEYYGSAAQESDYWSLVNFSGCPAGCAAGVLATEGCAVTLQGKTVITGNTLNEYWAEQYDRDYGDLVLTYVETDGLGPNGGVGYTYITGESKLTDGSAIGILAYDTNAKQDEEASYILSESNTADLAQYFFSNSGLFSVVDAEDTVTTGNYILMYEPAKEYICTTVTGARTSENLNNSYAFNGDYIEVTVTVKGSSFAGADFYVDYDPAVLQPVSYDESKGTYTDIEATDLPTGFTASGSVSKSGKTYTRLTGSHVLAQKGMSGLTEDGLLPADYELGKLYFRVKSSKTEILNAGVSAGGKLSLTPAAAAMPADAPNAKSVADTLYVAPCFDIELVSDYVSGKALAVLYTESENVRFTIDNEPFYGIENNADAAYAYGAKAESLAEGQKYLSSGTSNNDRTYTYAYVVDVASEGWSLTEIYNRLGFYVTDENYAQLNKAVRELPANITFAGDERWNVNSSTKIDLYDAVSAAGVYNVNEEMLGSAAVMAEYMPIILKADVNRDGIVDMKDASEILNHYAR